MSNLTGPCSDASRDCCTLATLLRRQKVPIPAHACIDFRCSIGEPPGSDHFLQYTGSDLHAGIHQDSERRPPGSRAAPQIFGTTPKITTSLWARQDRDDQAELRSGLGQCWSTRLHRLDGSLLPERAVTFGPPLCEHRFSTRHASPYSFVRSRASR